MAGRLPVVVALGSVDPALVTGVFDGHCRFVPDPGAAELSLAAGAIVRADARVDQALLDQAPALRVVARTGVGATLGVVGYGRIGQRTAALGAAFGMRILAYDPVSEPPADVRCTDLGDLAGRSDVITLHLPLTGQTRHLVDDAFLARVRPGAVLVNCSRGDLHRRRPRRA
jgi:phosphoglycerate dehydrogenase-like enzyme